MSFNLQIIAGNVGKDPEVRTMPNGDKVASFSVATSTKWKNKSGEKQDRTTWHNVTFFGNTANVIESYVKKGSLVLVQGETRHEKYQDKDTGADRYSTKIIGEKLQLLGGKGGDGSNQQSGNNQAANKASTAPAGGDFDSDIPFSQLQSSGAL